MPATRTYSGCLRLVRRRISIHNAARTSQQCRTLCSQIPLLQQVSQSKDRSRSRGAADGAAEAALSKPTTTDPVPSNIPPSPEAPNNDNDSPSYPPPTGQSTAKIQQHLSSTLGGSEKSSSPLSTRLASKLTSSRSATGESYLIYGRTKDLVSKFAAQADYTIPESQRQDVLKGRTPPKTAGGEDLGQPVDIPPVSSSSSAAGSRSTRRSWWFSELDLPPTFSTWSQVTYLHIYIFIVRLRAIREQQQLESGQEIQEPQFIMNTYQQCLLDQFSHAAEEKMVIFHSMTARGVRNRYLKDLFLQWRGLLAAYDEGLVKGDAVLAAAIWRNLWKAADDVDWFKVAMVVGFVRRSVDRLAQVPDELIVKGVVQLEDGDASDKDGGGGGDGQIKREGRKGGESFDVFDLASRGLRDLIEAQSRGVSEEPKH